MTDNRDSFAAYDRVYLENLSLAVRVLLRLGEDPDMLNNAFESELYLFRDRIEHALLSQTAPPGPTPAPGL